MILDAPGATLTPSSVTAFLLEASAGTRGAEVVLRVDEGVVEFAGDRGTLLVREGESASLRGDGSPTPASGYTRAERSEFDAWVGERVRGLVAPDAPATADSYLPDELGSYRGTLARHGSWDYEPDYGYVWYPTVAVDWRPYSVGRWDRVGAYGWFWIGHDPWAWPTHHYGRWGYRSGRWFWMPRRAWAPAWVSWSVGPGYVGWCPLGYDDRPVFSFGVGFNSWGGSYYVRSRGYDRYDYWRGWSVLASDRFHSRRYHYGRDYVDARRLSRDVTSAFVTQRVPPSWRGRSNYAVPRSSASPGAWSSATPGTGRIAVPRVAGPRGESASGAEPYERARPYMDRRAVARPSDPSPGTEPYDRARPYMDRRAAPGAARSPGGASPGVAVPRRSPAATPEGQSGPKGMWRQPAARPPQESPRVARPSRGSGAWGASAPSDAQRPPSAPERRYAAPRAEPRGADRPAPRSYSAPERSSPRSGGSRPSWGGSAAPRSAPRAASPSSGRGAPSGGATPRGGSQGQARSRSPRG